MSRLQPAVPVRVPLPGPPPVPLHQKIAEHDEWRREGALQRWWRRRAGQRHLAHRDQPKAGTGRRRRSGCQQTLHGLSQPGPGPGEQPDQPAQRQGGGDLQRELREEEVLGGGGPGAPGATGPPAGQVQRRARHVGAELPRGVRPGGEPQDLLRTRRHGTGPGQTQRLHRGQEDAAEPQTPRRQEPPGRQLREQRRRSPQRRSAGEAPEHPAGAVGDAAAAGLADGQRLHFRRPARRRREEERLQPTVALLLPDLSAGDADQAAGLPPGGGRHHLIQPALPGRPPRRQAPRRRAGRQLPRAGRRRRRGQAEPVRLRHHLLAQELRRHPAADAVGAHLAAAVLHLTLPAGAELVRQVQRIVPHDLRPRLPHALAPQEGVRHGAHGEAAARGEAQVPHLQRVLPGAAPPVASHDLPQLTFFLTERGEAPPPSSRAPPPPGYKPPDWR